MLQKKNVLISGASYDGVNRNSVLREYVKEGFEDIVSEGIVREVSLEFVDESLIKYQPDILLLFGSCMPDEVAYYALKKKCQELNVLLVFWLHDDPYEFDYGHKVVDVADVIFSNDKWASKHYSHDKVFHMPLAASKKAHYRPINNEYELDVFFCGVAFKNRAQLIQDLDAVLKQYRTLILGDEWPDSSADYLNNIRIKNNEFIDYCASSKTVLNIGRHFNYSNNKYVLSPSTPGPRTFEAGMAGTVQFYFVESLEILDYYDDEKEIVLFDSIKDFTEKLEHLIDDKVTISSISQSAQQKTLAEHTYSNRAESILKILDKYT